MSRVSKIVLEANIVQSFHPYIAVRVRVQHLKRLANMPCPDQCLMSSYCTTKAGVLAQQRLLRCTSESWTDSLGCRKAECCCMRDEIDNSAYQLSPVIGPCITISQDFDMKSSTINTYSPTFRQHICLCIIKF